MKNWRNYLILSIAIVLILVSFVIYGMQVMRTIIPAGSTPQQIAHLTHEYGLDRPVIVQYEWFLSTFSWNDARTFSPSRTAMVR